VWKIDILETQGQDGTAPIGKSIDIDDDSINDLDDVKCSFGSPNE
jgi:hypothetical protein